MAALPYNEYPAACMIVKGMLEIDPTKRW